MIESREDILSTADIRELSDLVPLLAFAHSCQQNLLDKEAGIFDI